VCGPCVPAAYAAFARRFEKRERKHLSRKGKVLSNNAGNRLFLLRVNLALSPSIERNISGTTLLSILPRTGAFDAFSQRRLFQRGRDTLEVRFQGGADTVDGSDDHDRDAGGDQAVFDGSGAGLVLQEARNKVLDQIKLHLHVAGRN
jgi:hypothetical protein